MGGSKQFTRAFTLIKAVNEVDDGGEPEWWSNEPEGAKMRWCHFSILSPRAATSTSQTVT